MGGRWARAGEEGPRNVNLSEVGIQRDVVYDIMPPPERLGGYED